MTFVVGQDVLKEKRPSCLGQQHRSFFLPDFVYGGLLAAVTFLIVLSAVILALLFLLGAVTNWLTIIFADAVTLARAVLAGVVVVLPVLVLVANWLAVVVHAGAVARIIWPVVARVPGIVIVLAGAVGIARPVLLLFLFLLDFVQHCDQLFGF